MYNPHHVISLMDYMLSKHYLRVHGCSVSYKLLTGYDIPFITSPSPYSYSVFLWLSIDIELVALFAHYRSIIAEFNFSERRHNYTIITTYMHIVRQYKACILAANKLKLINEIWIRIHYMQYKYVHNPTELGVFIPGKIIFLLKDDSLLIIIFFHICHRHSANESTALYLLNQYDLIKDDV